MADRCKCCGNLPPCGAACGAVHENGDCATCQGGSYALNTPAPVKEGTPMPDQRSLTEQLRDVVQVCNERGYYDAADFVANILAGKERK